MKPIVRVSAKWTVDWVGDGAPLVGHVVRSVTATKRVAGYFRVTGVREIRTRAPLVAPVVARYRVHAEFLSANRTQPVDWTLTRHPRRAKPPGHDRSSPLLDAEGEAAASVPTAPGSEDC